MFQVFSDAWLRTGCSPIYVIQFDTVAPNYGTAERQAVDKYKKYAGGHLSRIGGKKAVEPPLEEGCRGQGDSNQIDQRKPDDEKIPVEHTDVLPFDAPDLRRTFRSKCVASEIEPPKDQTRERK